MHTRRTASTSSSSRHGRQDGNSEESGCTYTSSHTHTNASTQTKTEKKLTHTLTHTLLNFLSHTHGKLRHPLMNFFSHTHTYIHTAININTYAHSPTHTHKHIHTHTPISTHISHSAATLWHTHDPSSGNAVELLRDHETLVISRNGGERNKQREQEHKEGL